MCQHAPTTEGPTFASRDVRYFPPAPRAEARMPQPEQRMQKLEEAGGRRKKTREEEIRRDLEDLGVAGVSCRGRRWP